MKVQSNMKAVCLTSLVILLITGCTTITELGTPNTHTDYEIGNRYVLKQPVFLGGSLCRLGYNGTPTDLETFRKRRPELPIVDAGTELEVVRVHIMHIPNWGDTTHVTAKILSGPLIGTVAEITYLSEQRPRAFTGIDVNFIEKVANPKPKH